MVIAVGILLITINEKKVKAKVEAEIREYEEGAGVIVETEDAAEQEGEEGPPCLRR